MNAHTTIEPAFCIDTAHMQRSKLIERCAAFEHELARVADKAGISLSKKAPTGQRIDALQQALEDKATLNKFDKRISAILDQAEPIIALRNELAHGTMVLVQVEGATHLLVSNASRALGPIDLRALLRAEDMPQAACTLANLSNQLKQTLNPAQPNPPPPNPPSPRLPKPGAAAGP